MTEKNKNETLEERIRRAKARGTLLSPKEQQDADKQRSTLAAIARGMRIGFEFVGGIVVGIVLGLVLDDWLGTQPFMLTLCLFLGFGAGMMNIYRLINNMDATIGLNRTEFSVDSKDNKPEAKKDSSESE